MMLALVEITPWHWVGFIAFVLVFIALDLGVFRPRARTVGFIEALAWSGLWFGLAMLFGLGLAHWRGREEATEFVTGYLIELSLSLDNILVIVLIFEAFHVPLEFQRRVLTYGILGALLMRGIMIAAGAELVRNFSWTLYVFGAFLVFTGAKMLFARKESVEPDKNPVLRVIKKIFPVTPGLVGQNFFAQLNGRRALTPLALVLVFIETTDLIFALDSVPAVFSVTRQAFIVFTSNIFAILGLRSLYFLLAGAVGMFRYLKAGLSVVLVFVGVKMLIDPHDQPPRWFQHEISTVSSLLVIGGILTLAIALSLAAARREDARKA
jgi:tellurite resistance protein TerC